ncbi:MAG: hypothetical protein LBC19_01800 [Tannerella sp.]|jgi:hypothetical protein|nr:hypothetical protein [Tannerella sp.]
MKRFTKTNFFLLLKESKNIQSSSLSDGYNEFAGLLFAGNTAMDKEEYHNALVYTSVELASLTEVSEKKYEGIFKKPLALLISRLSLSVGKCWWKQLHKVARLHNGIKNAAN